MNEDKEIELGYVCPETGRIAVRLSDLANSELKDSVSSYFYDSLCDEGRTPWLTIISIEASLESENTFEVWMADLTSAKRMSGSDIVFTRASVAKAVAGTV
jgi:hypothetical protein